MLDSALINSVNQETPLIAWLSFPVTLMEWDGWTPGQFTRNAGGHFKCFQNGRAEPDKAIFANTSQLCFFLALYNKQLVDQVSKPCLERRNKTWLQENQEAAVLHRSNWKVSAEILWLKRSWWAQTGKRRKNSYQRARSGCTLQWASIHAEYSLWCSLWNKQSYVECRNRARDNKSQRN